MVALAQTNWTLERDVRYVREQSRLDQLKALLIPNTGTHDEEPATYNRNRLRDEQPRRRQEQ